MCFCCGFCWWWWLPVQVSFRRGFQHYSPLLSSSFSSSEHRFLQLSALCASAEPPTVCSTKRGTINYVYFCCACQQLCGLSISIVTTENISNWKINYITEENVWMNNNKQVFINTVCVGLTWLPPAVSLWPSSWPSCPGCWPVEPWPLTASPAHL